MVKGSIPLAAKQRVVVLGWERHGPKDDSGCCLEKRKNGQERTPEQWVTAGVQVEERKALHWVVIGQREGSVMDQLAVGESCLRSSEQPATGRACFTIHVHGCLTRSKWMVHADLGAQGSLPCCDFTSVQAWHPSGLQGDSSGTPIFGSIMALALEGLRKGVFESDCWSRWASAALQPP